MNQDIAGKPTLFTIGHSDHQVPEFLALLARHRVDAIADVRSQPYSRFHGQFNRETLAELLTRAGIQYSFMGRELGARRSESESYRDRQARYDLICKLPAFVDGLDRLRGNLAKQRICLLCAEKDPITCHRTILVCRHLRSEPIDIQHIAENGSLESTDQIETRLLHIVGLPPTNLFQDRSELIDEAYDIQSERIAYTESAVSEFTSGATT
jgi:uncharacterized protein (DUF488 family)